MLRPPTRAPKAPGEADAAYEHFRAWIGTGGVEPDGAVVRRETYAATARRRGVRPRYIRTLASRHRWRDRARDYDNGILEEQRVAEATAGEWATLLSRSTRSILESGLDDASTSEKIAVMKAAENALEAHREMQSKRPIVIEGIDPETIRERLTAEEQDTLTALVKKLG